MALTFISVCILTVLKIIICHLSLWVCVDIVCVILFCLRCVGATFKVKVLCILHGVSLALWLLWTFMFGGWDAWPRMIAYLVINLIICGIMIYEDFAYVIVEKEERIEQDDEDSNSK